MRSRIWTYLFSMLVTAIALSLCFNLVLAFILKGMVNAIVRGETVLMLRSIGLAITSLLVGLPLAGVSGYVMKRCARQTITEIRVKVFNHLQNLSLSSFEQRHSGGLVSRCTNDLQTMENIYLQQIYTLVLVVLTGLIAIGAILVLEWQLGLLALLVGGITTFINITFARPLRQASDTIQAHWGTLTERLTDLLQGLPVIKMFHLEPVMGGLYTGTNEALSVATMTHARTDSFFKMTDYFLGWFRDIGFLVLGLFMLMRGATELGTVLAIVELMRYANFFLFKNIGNLITDLQKSLAGAGRVFELLDSPVEPERYTYSEGHISVSDKSKHAMVEIRNMTFRYEASDLQAAALDAGQLHNIAISVRQGQMAALVGLSGSGKSTIVKLLLGFYPISSGSIIINGKHIEQYSLMQLRELIAYVPQDAYLFAGTIEENIRYGRPNASKDETIAAAKAANAHNFIIEQQHTYNTLVGERGVKLSGGQRQRIAIARAFLKDAPILLLDEATSALDSDSEQLVQEALNILARGRTTIAIAHRLSTIKHADIIYVIDKGRIVEQGKHQDLVTHGGIYNKLSNLQFG